MESPHKARTIAGFLGKDFVVESSIGHIRDLPRSASEVPAALKKAPWARLGVDVDNGFKPLYIVDPDKKQQIQKLKGLLADASELYLATDEDREGESIAWHLLEVLKPKVPVKRMVFHEITRQAIKQAIESPRDIDRRLVDAQEARRILDRLYGYEVSPVLWKKVLPRLSAGRVQSVAIRVIVEREKARMRFRRASYWDVEATLDAGGTSFTAELTSSNDRRLATGKDFGEDGKLLKPDLLHLGEAAARSLADRMMRGTFSVTSVDRKPTKRSPSAPFMTSTLQQEASRKLRFTASRTMRAAQRLYEGGFITYMRTDSTQLGAGALTAARSQIERMYGAAFLPAEPRVYAKKVKNAQEAHEAIRPAGDVFRLPEEVAAEVGSDEARLYELVWMRTIASQMKDALGESVQVKIGGKLDAGDTVELSASGHTITFAGFLRAYVEGSDDPAAELEGRERPLPRLDDGQALGAVAMEPKGHETQPPARYTEATLVQKLEELGVGRPSTYASIISTIMDRGYVWKRGAALVPSFKAFAVVNLLEKHFSSLVDYAFTAKMEDDLDSIAQGDRESGPWLERFYFGEAGAKKKATKGSAPPSSGGAIQSLGLRTLVADRLDEIDARAINSLPLGSDSEGREIVIRVGKFGPYLARADETASIPEDLPPDELTLEKAEEILRAPSGDRLLGQHPETNEPVYARSGRYGPYVQLGEAGGDEKPKTASLLPSMSPDTLTLADALKMLSLPRVVGLDEEGVPITATLGRYGGYIQRGKDSRSLESEELVFTLTVPEALAVLAQPKFKRARAAAPPLKELGNDPVSGKPIRVMQGRFGLYVTDGETNATLRRDDSLETLSEERAIELMQERREKDAAGGGGRRGAGRRGARGAKAGATRATGQKPGAARAGKTPLGKRAAPAADRSAGNGADPARAVAERTAAKKPAKKAGKKTAAKKPKASKGSGKKQPATGT